MTWVLKNFIYVRRFPYYRTIRSIGILHDNFYFIFVIEKENAIFVERAYF